MELTPTDIQLLIADHEGVDVEFKLTTGQLNRGMETLCGMMNGSGGIVIFGIHDNGKIIGQEVSDKTTRDIGEALRKFDPAVDIQPSRIKLPGSDKSLIAFQSSGIESDKPYMWDGKPFQLHDSVTSVMPREKFFRLYERQHGLKYRWGNEVNPELSIDRLDENLIRRVVNIGVRKGRLSSAALGDNIPDMLRRLELIRDGKLCNAAAVLFGKNLSSYSQCMLRLARFKGKDKTYFIDNQRAEGNIFELVDASMSFFFKHLNLSGDTHHHIQRAEELEIPYDALREGISNALCHRAWQFETSTIGITVYDDRIVIENAGHFPPSLSPGELATEEYERDKNISLPPNETIAKVMFIGGLIENWGRGLAMMDNLCESVGLPAPTFRDNGSFVWLTFTRPNALANPAKATSAIENEKVAINNAQVAPQNYTEVPQNAQVDDENAQAAAQNGAEMSKNAQVDDENAQVDDENAQVAVNLFNLESIVKVTSKTKDRMLEIINFIGEDWFTASDLFDISGLKNRRSFRRTIIERLLEASIIRLERPDSPNAPNQRYGLTVKGKAIFYSQKELK